MPNLQGQEITEDFIRLYTVDDQEIVITKEQMVELIDELGKDEALNQVRRSIALDLGWQQLEVANLHIDCEGDGRFTDLRWGE